jgi:XTP/dITP diphosphohydrolase
MHTLIFATNNRHKLDEVRSIPGLNYDIIGLKEAGIDIEIPEPYDTLEQNASEKSGVIYSLTGKDCFSEDTGLEVDALNGEPGVKSARYAGDDRSFSNNIDKLLHRMEGKADRNARFRAVISLMLGGKEYIFEGICKGTILADIRGNEGFGYDPVFVPEGATKTFAEMDMPEKNRYSHRKKAIDRLTRFLNDHFNK